VTGPLTKVHKQALSVSVATGLYGVSFGAMSVVAGLSIPQTAVLSLLMFSGGSQFAFVGVIGSGGAAATAVTSAALLGVRNMVYGPLLTPFLPRWGWRRAVAAQVTIDESAAVAVSQPDPASARLGFWWTGLGVYVLWNAMTLAGAFLGDRLGDPARYGLDAAAAAAFLGLLWPRLADPSARWTALTAAVVALVVTPFVPAGLAVLAAAAVSVGIAVVTHRTERVVEVSR
jgi:predicted branched-subunit amino acid permease